MVEPMEMQHILNGVIAGAAVVIFGALYALLFASARVYRRPRLMPVAYGAYAGLFAAVMALARALELSGFWELVVAVMLVGYLLAPHGIWYLCVGTHRAHAVDYPEEDQGQV